jgi:hypothetical protein
MEFQQYLTLLCRQDVVPANAEDAADNLGTIEDAHTGSQLFKGLTAQLAVQHKDARFDGHLTDALMAGLGSLAMRAPKYFGLGQR